MDVHGLGTVLDAVKANNAIQVEKLLERKLGKDPELDVDAQDDDGNTLLHHAVHQGHGDVVAVLLELGSDPTLHNDVGYAPVHQAAKSGHLECLQLMLENCPNPNIPADANVVYSLYTPLHFAVQHNQTAVIRYLLTVPEIDVNVAAGTGHAPLHIAANNNSDVAVGILVREGGADVNVRVAGKDRSTALMLACGRSHIAVVEALLAEGADTNLADNNGDTALHHALKVQVQRIFSFRYDLDDLALDVTYKVIRAGADISILNVDEDLPLDLISAEGAAIFELVSRHPASFQEIPTFTDLLKMSSSEVEVLALESNEEALLVDLIAKFRQERKEVEEEEEKRGSCPFVDSKGKFRRRKPPPSKYVDNSVASEKEKGKCPLGFTSEGGKEPSESQIESWKKMAETGATCPLGFGSKKSELETSGSKVNKKEREEREEKNIQSSQCPYHIALHTIEENKVPLAALAVVASVIAYRYFTLNRK